MMTEPMTEPFKTLLIYPPAADFTQPYPAIPYLAAFLRQQGEEVMIKDLNIEAHHYIFHRDFLEKCRAKVEQRFTLLDGQDALNLEEQKEYLTCMEALGTAPESLEPEKSPGGFYGLRDQDTLFDFPAYQKACNHFNQALAVVSAAYFPTQLHAAEYTTPFFLSSREDILDQTNKTVNPFLEFYEDRFIPLVEKEKPGLIGISVTYPSQILQMFAIADLVKKRFPGIHICAGGAFLCRMVLNMPRKKFNTLFEYLDSIIIYEGETALHRLIQHLKTHNKDHERDGGISIPNIISYDRAKDSVLFPPKDVFVEDLDQLPPPDFAGFPLDQYLSPRVVLPYSPTRGCYWNKCAFCHYGATRTDTARYRERNIKKVVDDMEKLADIHQIDHFAFSIDVMSPAMALKIADELIKRQRPYQWNTEVKIESYFTDEQCKKLKQGGCLSVAIGLESGNRRILELMDKGYAPETAEQVIRNFSNAGICVQVMSFLDFPGETLDEALETIEFISRNKEHISLFIMGNFELLPGSRVFRNFRAFGLKSVNYSKGDEFKLLCQYKEKTPAKQEEDSAYYIDPAYLKLGEQYAGLLFPFAGAVSTNHTFLYFDRLGGDIFKTLSSQGDTGKSEPVGPPDDSARPRINPAMKLMESNFSSAEMNGNLETGTEKIKEIIKKTGQSHRQVFQRLKDKHRVLSSRSTYLLLDDMKWSELPDQVKQVLALCNGENEFKDIVLCQGEAHRDIMEHMLNELFSMELLTV